MKVNYNESIRTLFIKFDGEIDHHSCGEIAVLADDAIKKYLPLKVIFDFENVNFMDSAGIGMLLGRYKTAKMVGSTLNITNVKPSIKKVLEMSGVLKIIPIVED